MVTLALALLVYFTTFSEVHANGPEVNFDVRLEPIACVQIDNLSSLPHSYVLLFDYDRDTGEQMGKPWKRVEEGKCYSGGNVVALPTYVAQSMGDALDSPTNYNPRLSIHEWTGPGGAYEECGVEQEFPTVCEALNNRYYATGSEKVFIGHKYNREKVDILGLLGTPYEKLYLYYYGSNAQLLLLPYAIPYATEQFPDMDVADIPMVDIIAMEEFKKIEVYPRFERCDLRKRVAYVYRIADNASPADAFEDYFASEKTLWTFEDNTVVDLTASLHTFEHEGKRNLVRYTLMGCLDEVLELRALATDLEAQRQERAGNGVHATNSDVVEQVSLNKLTEPSQTPVEELETLSNDAVTLLSTTTTSTLDESVVTKEAERARQKDMRMVYFYTLPPLGVMLITLLFFVRRKKP